MESYEITHFAPFKLNIIIIIEKYALPVCLSVCLYTINVRTTEPIGPNFFCGTLRDPGRSRDDRIFKNLPLTKLDF